MACGIPASTSRRRNCRYFFDSFLSGIGESPDRDDYKGGDGANFCAQFAVMRPDNAQPEAISGEILTYGLPDASRPHSYFSAMYLPLNHQQQASSVTAASRSAV
ncbi:hypothetical protein O8B93_05725 [Agrobacterium rhizogenes]|uniref:hypothetical protein n=1 Tax=Rhizobium rhizogenes TaxID=359 RepID=UPI0022B6BC21|nr:hypothetical protein [Rhizobium rhizogenes]MCZ7447095.1 hypothetical protein [Rhizobium rhizogenes]